MDSGIDLAADLNAQDDDGRGWSLLAEARDARAIGPGLMLAAGSKQARAVVRVVSVDPDGQVRFAVLPGSVARNSHLTGRTPA